jgi:transcriptional regulator with XRE-family HTH domain
MTTEICILLGKKVRDLRRKRGWRQIDLAAHASLSKTHINELERGKREVGLNTLDRLASALDMTISELMKSIDK